MNQAMRTPHVTISEPVVLIVPFATRSLCKSMVDMQMTSILAPIKHL